ncbi:MAG: InlB B-repeat-containing protein [Bacteroidales bacterium]|nr:InlB B-repeat-containing protein [Bacteroidales bacterium]
MNLNIAKYTLLAATVSLAACQRDDDGYTEQLPAAEGNMSFSASFESSLSKAALHYDSEVPTSSSKIVTYFQSSDALSVFDGYANNKFTTQDNGANATFAGRAKASEKGYLALFPYNPSATINADGTLSATIPTKQNGGKLDGIIALAYTTASGSDFTLRNATSLIGLHTKGNIKSLKVESTHPIAGNVTVAMDAAGLPSVSGATEKTVELIDSQNGGYISVMPSTGANLVVNYTLNDGTNRTVYFRDVTFTRSQILDFGNIDELATITFDVSNIAGAAPINSYSVKQNTSPFLPNSIGEGITYNGWIGSDGNFYLKGETIQNIASDMSFVAIAGNEKILIFQYNGKSMFIQFKEGTAVTMPTVTEAPEGKVFKGWSESANPYQVQYEPGKDYVITVNNASRNIYAFYDYKDVTITLDANGGTFDDNTTKKEITHKYGTKVELTPKPTKAGQWFKGWDGAATHDFKSDVTFKAIWGAISKITYKDFNGNTVKTEDYNDGGDVTINNSIQLNAMIKAWNTKQDGSGTEYIPGQTYNGLTGNITLYPIKSDQKPSAIDRWTIIDF